MTVDPNNSSLQQNRTLVTLQVLIALLFVGAAVAASLAWPAAGPAILVGVAVLGVLLVILKL